MTQTNWVVLRRADTDHHVDFPVTLVDGVTQVSFANASFNLLACECNLTTMIRLLGNPSRPGFAFQSRRKLKRDLFLFISWVAPALGGRLG